MIIISLDDTINMINNIGMVLSIILVNNILQYITNNDGNIFDEKTTKLMLYSSIGIIVYSIVIKPQIQKLLQLTENEKNKEN